jgi:hypothetical protein
LHHNAQDFIKPGAKAEREDQGDLSKRGELKRRGKWSRNEKLMIFSETSRRFQTSLLEDAGFALKYFDVKTDE